MKIFHIISEQNHMATTFSFTVAAPEARVGSAKQILEECHQLVASLERELSEFDPLSPIHQLNEAPVSKPIKVGESTLRLIAASERLSEMTENGFSCLAKSQGPAKIGWSARDQTVWRETPGTHVGFGAIGKGFALDCARQKVEQEGFHNYILNAGGSSQIISGFSSAEEPWTWGWSWTPPQCEPQGYSFSHLSGLPLALGVSGTETQKKHLLDPRTGTAIDGPKSALVATPSAMEADALSTALFVNGWEKSFEHFKKLIASPALALIDAKVVPRWNGLFQKYWGALATLILVLGRFGLAADDEGTAIDLNDLGVEDFLPYQTTRNTWWMLLPAVALLIVLIHLKDSRPRPPTKTDNLEGNL